GGGAAGDGGEDVTGLLVDEGGAVPGEVVVVDGRPLEELVGHEGVGGDAGVGGVPVDAVGAPGEGQAAGRCPAGQAGHAVPREVGEGLVAVGRELRRFHGPGRVQHGFEGTVGAHGRGREAGGLEAAAAGGQLAGGQAGQGLLVDEVDIAVVVVDEDAAVAAPGRAQLVPAGRPQEGVGEAAVAAVPEE